MALGRNISPGQGETYYRKDDYYLEREGGEEHKLEWGGRLARELGLSGPADSEAWKEALNGRFPGGTAVDGGTFLDEKGRPQRRAGTDFEFSAPKSVSIQALVFGEDRLVAAHRQAVSAAMAELEKQVGLRKREGPGVRSFHATGSGLTGRVTHLTSREGDPHLHDHVVFLNVTKNAEGRLQAMTNDRMMHYQRLAQEVYHAELSYRLDRLGYALEKGTYGEPQIAGTTREQIEHFSGRSAQIEAYIKEKWGLDWRSLSREERNARRHWHEEAWTMTRKAKSIRELDGLRERWTAEANAIGVEKILPGKPGKARSPGVRRSLAQEALSFAVDHHTERESAVGEAELMRTALAAGRGTLTLRDLQGVLEEAQASGELIRQKDGPAGTKPALVTSREALAREKRILRMEREGREAVAPCLSPFQAEARIRELDREGTALSGEQKAALRMALTTDCRFTGINGSAGTGKTTLLKPAVESLRAAGFSVLGLGPQHSAVHALHEAGILNARTLQSWLSDGQVGGGLSPGSVVVIDEAGLANAQDLEAAMARVERAGARAVLVGDVKQYESVAAGPAFRLLQERGMETVAVTEMRRQEAAPETVREAARLSVSRPEKALERLADHVREIREPEARVRALADGWLSAEDPSDTLVLTGTREARDAVNAHVRNARGLLGTGREYAVFRPEDRTAAELRKIGSYEPGLEIRFSRDYRSLGVKSGDVGQVVHVDGERGTVRLGILGAVREFEPRRLSGKGWEVGRREALEFSPGDRVRITGNALKKDGVTNGMKGTVREASAMRLRLRLDDGKEAEIPVGSAPLEIDHGYAQTGYSAQGLSARTVILDLPAGSPATHRRAFYTNLTRTRNAVRIFTDDRERLVGAVVREKDKTLAHDAVGEGPEIPPPGLRRDTRDPERDRSSSHRDRTNNDRRSR